MRWIWMCIHLVDKIWHFIGTRTHTHTYNSLVIALVWVYNCHASDVLYVDLTQRCEPLRNRIQYYDLLECCQFIENVCKHNIQHIAHLVVCNVYTAEYVWACVCLSPIAYTKIRYKYIKCMYADCVLQKNLYSMYG